VVVVVCVCRGVVVMVSVVLGNGEWHCDRILWYGMEKAEVSVWRLAMRIHIAVGIRFDFLIIMVRSLVR